MITPKFKRCPKCKVVRSAKKFGRRTGAPDGLQWSCSPCRQGKTAATKTAKNGAATKSSSVIAQVRRVLKTVPTGSDVDLQIAITTTTTTTKVHKIKGQA